MAYIQIIQLKGGQAGCSDYFFKDGEAEKTCRILVGEVAYVPDGELKNHLRSDLVAEVKGEVDRGRIVNPEDIPDKGKQ